MYTAILLDKSSHNLLLSKTKELIPQGWILLAHHMTINMGMAKDGPCHDLLDASYPLIANSFACNDRVMAVGIETLCSSFNKIKHVTIAVNGQVGAKPVESNQLTEWMPIAKPLLLHGTIKELE